MRPRMPSRHHRDLTDAQWAILDTLIPGPTPRRDGRGHPWDAPARLLPDSPEAFMRWVVGLH